MKIKKYLLPVLWVLLVVCVLLLIPPIGRRFGVYEVNIIKDIHFYVPNKDTTVNRCTQLSCSDQCIAEEHLRLILEKAIKCSQSMYDSEEYWMYYDSIPIEDFSAVDYKRLLKFVISDTHEQGRSWEFVSRDDGTQTFECYYHDNIWVISNEFKLFLTTLGFSFSQGGDSYDWHTKTLISIDNVDGSLYFFLWIHMNPEQLPIISFKAFSWKDPKKKPVLKKVEKKTEMDWDYLDFRPIPPPPPPPPPPPSL